jgi:hypothetical protein
MPRVTRKNSTQENVVDINSSPEKDDKSNIKVAAAISAARSNNHPESQCVMIVPGKTV